VLWAWLLLGEMPAVIQLLGGAAIVAGVVLIKLDEYHEPVNVTSPQGHAPSALTDTGD